jgi:hypothetical protein
VIPPLFLVTAWDILNQGAGTWLFANSNVAIAKRRPWESPLANVPLFLREHSAARSAMKEARTRPAMVILGLALKQANPEGIFKHFREGGAGRTDRRPLCSG